MRTVTIKYNELEPLKREYSISGVERMSIDLSLHWKPMETCITFISAGKVLFSNRAGSSFKLPDAVKNEPGAVVLLVTGVSGYPQKQMTADPVLLTK